MKKLSTVIIIGLLCLSLFSILAPKAKAEALPFDVLWRTPLKDGYWEVRSPWMPGGVGPGSLGVDAGDVDGDNVVDIAAIPQDWVYGGAGPLNTLQVFKSDGSELWSTSLKIDGGHVAISDVDRDGKGEVFAFATTEDTGNSDAIIYAFDHDGTPLWTFTDTVDYGFWAVSARWIAFTNIDVDPQLELIVSNGGYPNRYTYALDTNGTLLWRFTGNEDQHMLFGDVTGDGVEEVIILSNVGHMVYVVNKATGGLIWSYSTVNYNIGALGDINGDNINDLVVGSGAADIYPPNNCLYAIRNDGALLWSKDIAYGGQNSPTYPVLEDLNNDAIKDIVVGAEQKIKTYSNDGTSLWTYGDSVFFGGKTPELYRFDIDRDGQGEIIFLKGKDVYQLSNDGTAALFGTLPVADPWELKRFGGRVTETMSTETKWLSSGDMNNDGFDELICHEIIDGTFYLTVIKTGAYVDATVNIDPDTLNLHSNGEWITAYIELSGSTDVNNINVSSILLNSTIPVDTTAPVTIGDDDNDGIPDLMVKFDRAMVESWIYQSVGMRYTIHLTITGNLLDETPFEGTDTTSVVWTGQRAPCKR